MKAAACGSVDPAGRLCELSERFISIGQSLFRRLLKNLSFANKALVPDLLDLFARDYHFQWKWFTAQAIPMPRKIRELVRDLKASGWFQVSGGKVAPEVQT
jgi:hypothetical protein